MFENYLKAYNKVKIIRQKKRYNFNKSLFKKSRRIMLVHVDFLLHADTSLPIPCPCCQRFRGDIGTIQITSKTIFTTKPTPETTLVASKKNIFLIIFFSDQTMLRSWTISWTYFWAYSCEPIPKPTPESTSCTYIFAFLHKRDENQVQY